MIHQKGWSLTIGEVILFGIVFRSKVPKVLVERIQVRDGQRVR